MSNLNSTEAALLGLLHDGEANGAQLMAAAAKRFGSFWTLTRSQVYRELPSLAKRGYVQAPRKGRRASRSHPPYWITGLGQLKFSEWLSEPAGVDHLRNPLLLRVAFGHLHTPEQLAGLYAERAEAHGARLVELRQELQEARESGTPDRFRVSTLEFVVTYQEALVRWIESAPSALSVAA